MSFSQTLASGAITSSGAITATGAIAATGNVTASSNNFLGSATGVLLAPTTSGTVYLRPGGSGSTTGQVLLTTTLANFSASITSSGSVTASGNNFIGSATTVTLGPSSAGTVLLRPNGAGSSAGQVSVASTGAVTASGAVAAPSITLGGGKVLSKITVSSAAPGVLADGELYLRWA